MRQLKKEPMKRFRDDIIADTLRITPEEARLLPRWAKLTTTSEVDEVDAKLSPNRRVEYRKQVIVQIIAEHGGRMLPCRQLARLLGERGIQVSHMQVNKYCRSMANLPQLTHPLQLNP
jgi:hypothetical protein